MNQEIYYDKKKTKPINIDDYEVGDLGYVNLKDKVYYVFDGSKVHANKGSVVDAHDGSVVFAWDGSVVNAQDGPEVHAWGGSVVFAWDGSVVNAHDGSEVYAKNGSEVFAYDGSEVYAYKGSDVYANDGSVVKYIDKPENTPNPEPKIKESEITIEQMKINGILYNLTRANLYVNTEHDYVAEAHFDIGLELVHVESDSGSFDMGLDEFKKAFKLLGETDVR